MGDEVIKARRQRGSMSERNTSICVAAVQAAPVYLDREGTLSKACRLIEEAGGNGARLVAFPEVYIPGYPYWVRYMDPFKAQKYTKELIQQSVRIPGEVTETLGQAARRANTYVVIGLNERDPHSTGTIYNTNLLLDPQGRILGRHRKLVPTYAEKLVWAPGDGLGLRVYDTELGKLGTLICGENCNPLARFLLIAEGEQLHVANYPSIPVKDPGGFNLAKDIEIRAAAHALEGKLFNVVSSSILDHSIVDALGATEELRAILQSGNSCHTAVYGPKGLPISGPLEPGYEGILYADVNLEDIIIPKLRHDVATSNYNRFDIISLQLQRHPLQPVHTEEARDQEPPLPLHELKRMVQLLRSLLEQGSLEEARATLEELQQALQRS